MNNSVLLAQDTKLLINILLQMQAIIELQNVHKSYYLGNQELPILKGIDLNIFKNEYVSLMGPSGSGKSTLMNILGCLDTLTSGRYRLNQKDVSSMQDDELAKVRNEEIGFVFQQFNLLPRLNAIGKYVTIFNHFPLNLVKSREIFSRKLCLTA